MATVAREIQNAIENADYGAIVQSIGQLIQNKQGRALSEEMAGWRSQAMFVSRLLPVLTRWNQEELRHGGLNLVRSQLEQSIIPSSVISTLYFGKGLYVIAGCRPSSAPVEILIYTNRGSWVHRQVQSRPSKFPQNRYEEGLMGFNYGYIGFFQLPGFATGINQLWVNGFPVDIVVQNLEESSYLDQVDDLLHLCRLIHLPSSELPAVMDDGLFTIACCLRDPLRDCSRWPELISEDEIIGHPLPVHPTLTIVIPLFRKWEIFIQGHLAAFALDSSFCSGEIEILYVVDDPSIKMDVLRWLRNHGSYHSLPIRVVALTRNMGFGMACNVGVSSARSKNIILMNSDIFPEESGWIDSLLSHLTAFMGALVAPFLTYETGLTQHCGMYVALDGTMDAPVPCNYHRMKGLDSNQLLHNLSSDDVLSESEALSGAMLAFRKEDYLDLGGFDPIFGRGDFEDLELSYRWKRRCGPLLLDPTARLNHIERQTMHIEGSDLSVMRAQFNALCAIRLCPEIVD